MKLQLKTITPVHVGNGEELYELDYVVANGYYYRVSQAEFFKFLVPISDAVNIYTDWINDNTKEIEDLKSSIRTAKRNRSNTRDYNQQLNYIRNNFNLLGFAKKIKQDKAFINFLNSESNVLKIPFQEKHLKGQVRGILNTGNKKPYLPGTSLKGAIRTALLYHYLTNYGNIDVIKSRIKEGIIKANQTRQNREKDKIKKHFADRIEQDAFYCKFQYTDKNGNIKFKSNDEKLDIFKFLHISDGMINTVAKDALSLEDIKLYLVIKNYNSKTKSSDFVAEEQAQAPYVEAIKPNTTIETSINFNIDFLFAIKDKLTTEGIKTKEGYQWIGLQDKIKRIFNLDINTLTAENLKTKQQEVINHIIKSLKIFSNKQIEKNKEWAANFKKHDKRKHYSDAIDNGFEALHQLQNNQNLIHLGFGTGFTGISELLYILDNEELKNTYKEVMEVFGIGDKPGANKTRKNDETYIAKPDKFPKSRRLSKTKNALTPLGWLTIVDDNTPKQITKTENISEKQSIKEIAKAVEAEYYNGKINYKRQIILEAVVVKSKTISKPNEVKLFITKDNTPIVQLMNYRSALDIGTVLKVNVQFSKKKKVVNTSFAKLKR
jgi:CRISPR type III-A-associated RAMP protein Csm5